MKAYKVKDKNKQAEYKKVVEIELTTLEVFESEYYYVSAEVGNPVSILMPDQLTSYSFTYLDPQDILTKVSLTCRSFFLCASNNIVWRDFLNDHSGFKYKLSFINQPSKRVPQFMYIGNNGFNYFSELMRNKISNKIQMLNDDKADFEFEGTRPNLITTLSNSMVQRLLQLKVVDFNYIYALNNEKRVKICDPDLFGKDFSTLLTKVEKNPGNEELKNSLRKKLKEVEAHKYRESYFRGFASYK